MKNFRWYPEKSGQVKKEKNKEETILPFVIFTLRNYTVYITADGVCNRRQGLQSVHHFIGATAAGKGFGLGFKGKAHTEDVAHCFP